MKHILRTFHYVINISASVLVLPRALTYVGFQNPIWTRPYDGPGVWNSKAWDSLLPDVLGDDSSSRRDDGRGDSGDDDETEGGDDDEERAPPRRIAAGSRCRLRVQLYHACFHYKLHLQRAVARRLASHGYATTEMLGRRGGEGGWASSRRRRGHDAWFRAREWRRFARLRDEILPAAQKKLVERSRGDGGWRVEPVLAAEYSLWSNDDDDDDDDEEDDGSDGSDSDESTQPARPPRSAAWCEPLALRHPSALASSTVTAKRAIARGGGNSDSSRKRSRRRVIVDSEDDGGVVGDTGLGIGDVWGGVGTTGA